MAKLSMTVPKVKTYDDEKERKAAATKAAAPSLTGNPYLDDVVGPVFDQIALKKKALALISDPHAPTGMKVSDYLDTVAQSGAMDADTKAAYEAEKQAKAADLKKQSQAAAAIAIQKERELEQYMASDERKQKQPVTTHVQTDSPMGDLGAFIGQSLFNKAKTGSFTGDETEGKLRTEADYYKNLSGQLLDQDTMEKDLAALDSWSQQDKHDLQTLYIHKGNLVGEAAGFPVAGATAADALDARSRLRQKYGAEAVDHILESYSRSQNAAFAQEAAKAGRENHGLLDTAVSIPLGIVGGVSSALSQGSQALADTLGLTSGRYQTTDPNTPADILSIYTDAVKAGGAEEFGKFAEATAAIHGADENTSKAVGALASTAYQAGISTLDNLAKIALTGGTGTLVLAGTQSFSSAMRAAAANGASPQQAAAMGLVSAASEILTEKLPLDNLLGNLGKATKVSDFGAIVLASLKQAGIEVTTEELNLITGIAAEALILREKSDYRKNIADMVASGVPYAEARSQANAAILRQAGQTALQSGLSGFMTSAGTSAAAQVAPANRFTEAAQEYDSQKQSATDRLSGLLDGILPQRKQTPAQATPTPAQAKEQSVIDLVDEAIATATGAPADPLRAAVDSFRQTGTVTNKQVTDILNNTRAVQKLVQETNLKLDGLTASQKRQNVKAAISAITQTEQVDTVQNTDYDNIKNTKGENIYAEGLQQNDRTGSIGDFAQRMAGVQSANRAESQGREQYGGVALDSGVLRVSDALSSAQQKRGTPTYPVRTTTSAPESYEQALIAGRNSDTKNGWCVTPKSAQELRDGNVRTYMNDTGTVGVGIASDGDIVAVFKNQNGGPRKAMDTMMPIAIEQGGDRLDCYGEGLVKVYSRYGFVPVARVEFNPEYANDGWTTDKGTPYIYVMMHNGDSAATVVENMGNYPVCTQSQLDALPTYSKDDYDAAMAYRDSLMDQRNIDDNQGTPPSAPNESVGAADQNFTGRAAYQDLLSDENSQRDRLGDVRPMEVPKVDAYGRKVSEFVGNAYGAEATPDSFVPIIEELVQEGALGYDTKTNAESLRDAAAVIKKKGMAGARNAITKNIANGKVGDTDIATAMLLYSQYASRKGQQAQDSAAELFVDLQMMATQTGRDLQLFKMLRKMTPQGQLMSVTKKVDRYVDALNKGRSKNNQAEVSIPKELMDEYTAAAQEAAVTDTPENQQRKDEAEQAIYAYAAANIPATLKEKWDSWRYLAMLGNPKTQIRNLVGNALFRPFVETKRYLGSAMEAMVLKPDQRTKSILGTDENSRALMAWAKQDAKTQAAKDRMEYTATTGDSANSQIGDKRQMFKTKALESARTGLNDLMSAEDMLFKRSAYATSLASFLKARGVTAQQLQNGSVDAVTLEAARSYAVEEAMKATFNDRNAFSDIFVNFRYKGRNPVMKALNAAGEGILPFRRTPANIVARATEYSPIGLAKTVFADSGKVKNGTLSAAQYIDNLAAGLTGTGAMALGYALAAGLFEGVRLVGNEDDADEKRMGHQSYALEIGDTSVTIDWAAPSVLPLFMGVSLYRSLNPDGEVVSSSVFAAFLDACANTLEPMLELSCLSSLNDLLTDVRYAEEGRELYSIAASAATSYFLQGLPTIGGQIEQAFETEKKSVHADASDPVVRELQETVGRATQKVPGVDLFQAEKVDAWGETQKETSVVESIFDAFINPSRDSQIEETAVDVEISRLNGVQGENVSPSTPPKTITYTGTDGTVYTDKRLSAEEYVSLAKTQGQKQRQLVEDILAVDAYAALTDEEKAKVIRYAYDYARDYARGEVLDGHPGITTKWMAGLTGNIADGIVRYVATGTVEKYTSLPIEKASYIDDLLDSILPPAGKDNATTQQKIAAVTSAGKLTDKEQQAVLKDVLSDSAYDKFLQILKLGYSNDDYADSYRIYAKEKDAGGKGTKARTIAAFQKEFGISEAAATALYEVYNPK